jgi:cyclohexanecarboxylate-CoA ligase/acyl-CoA synthetase
LESLQEWLLERGLSRRHLPECLVLVDDVPVTAAGKIRKLDLKKQLEAGR